MFTEQNRDKNTSLGCWEKIYVRSSVPGNDAHDHKHSLPARQALNTSHLLTRGVLTATMGGRHSSFQPTGETTE